MHNETYRIRIQAENHGTIHFDEITNRIVEIMFHNWHRFEQRSRMSKHNYYTYEFVTDLHRS